jgi:transposase-like protein
MRLNLSRPGFRAFLLCSVTQNSVWHPFYAFPKEHWKTIRTNNVLERLFGEVKRRSHKMAAAFHNEGSCILLFYAVIRSLHFNILTMPLHQPNNQTPRFYTTIDKLPDNR